MSSFPLSLAWAASTATRAVSSNSIGTTIPGSTIGSLTKRTGTTLVTFASAINPPKLNLLRSTLVAFDLFPASGRRRHRRSRPGTGPSSDDNRGEHEQPDDRQRDRRVHAVRDVDRESRDDSETHGNFHEQSN